MQEASPPEDIDTLTIASDSDDGLDLGSLTLTPQTSYYLPSTKIIPKPIISASKGLSPETKH